MLTLFTPLKMQTPLSVSRLELVTCAAAKALDPAEEDKGGRGGVKRVYFKADTPRRFIQGEELVVGNSGKGRDLSGYLGR